MKHFYHTLLLIGLSLFTRAQTTTPTGTSAEVGITEGQLSVSLTGGANYAIPIAVPPGINGVVPQISLAYSSQAGNGMAGYGWNTTGVSSITRIPRTTFHDTAVGGVNLDVNDRFALDGQRLIVKTGTTGIYGADGTVYETENFSNVKITSLGVSLLGAAYGPASFKVEYPDGSVSEYGITTDSRSITTWSISYWQNPQSVRISYTYNNTNNSIAIASIKYGAVGINTPINEIKFNYVTRTRPEQAYVGGQSITNTSILDNIVVTSSNIGFRKYTLFRDTATSLNYERLIKIIETSGDGTKSYNPTIFNYDTKAEGLISNPIATSIDMTNVSANTSSYTSGDYNGDGNMDFILYPTYGTYAKKKYWLFCGLKTDGTSNPTVESNTGAFDEIFTSTILYNTTGGFKLLPKQGWTIVKTDATTSQTTFSNYTNLDTFNPINLLGNKSYVFPTFSFTRQHICGDYTSIYADTYTVTKRYLSGDFNGDGLTDVIAVENELMYTSACDRTTQRSGGNAFFVNLDPRQTTGFVTSAGNIGSYSASSIQIADFNADGKSDIYVFNDNSCTVYGLNANLQFDILAQITGDTNITIRKKILMGDFNGDGKTDFFVQKVESGNEYIKYFSTGTTLLNTNTLFTSPISSVVNCTNNVVQIIPNDINKDGKTDLIYVNKSSCTTSGKTGITKTTLSLNVYKNMGVSFALEASINLDNNSPIGTSALPIFLNFDKINPNMEIDFISDNKILNFVSKKDFSAESRLKSIITGNGITETITYKPLVPEVCSYNCKPTYKEVSLVENYPNVDIYSAPGFQVVSLLEKKSTSVYKKQQFAYAGATSNMEGLGFLGFRATMRTNWYEVDSQIISSISKFDPNLRGANIENYTYEGLYTPETVANQKAPTTAVPNSIIVSDYTFATTDTRTASGSVIIRPGINGTIIKPTTGTTFLATIIPNYDATGFTETNTTPPIGLITKSLSSYEATLAANKVYKLQNVQSKNYNILDNTSSETNTIYDGYNNPLESITKLKNAGLEEQTTTTTVTYQTPNSTGRPTAKFQTVIAAGDSMSSKETYDYGTGTEINLLKKIEKFGNNTTAIKETNVYDSFGNIITKTIAATGITDRVTSYKYDTSGRFLMESTDIETLKTSYVYNPDGTLKSETNPYNLTTSYLYDSWFKKTQTTDYLGKINNYAYTRDTEKTKITTTGYDDGSYSEELFDDLGRKIRTGVKDIQGNMSYKDYLYDIYDRNYSVSEPYTASPSLWSTTAYDIYGRPKTVTSFTGKIMSMVYEKLKTTVTDSSTGKTKASTKNAIGNVVTMTEAPIGGSVYYTYFANGNLKETNYLNNKISITQDGWGRKTSLNDPSAGLYTYEYNALGETTKETTPNGETSFILDPATSKLTSKTIKQGATTLSTTTYTYDPTSKLPTGNTFTNVLENNSTITNAIAYDNKKRVTGTTETTPYAKFDKTVTYDNWGRIDTETSTATLLAGGKTSTTKIQNFYKNGYAYQIKDYPNTTTLWQTDVVNARGQLVKVTLGNTIIINNTYDAMGYGYLSNTKHTLSTSTVMELGNVFDPQRGNLTSRTNSLFSTNETFTYDSLDRLLTFPNGLGATETQSYQDDGRIKTNTLGTYNYNTAKKYQNTSVTLTPDTKAYYQATPLPLQTITYNTFKAPIEISQDGVDKISFVYNDSNDRSIMYYGGLGLKDSRKYRKHYSADGTMEIKENRANGVVEFVTYIGGDGYTAPIVYKKTYPTTGTPQEQTLYLHRDYQGSILAITNNVGVVLEKRLFDAWGNIAKVQDGNGNTLNGLTILDRGYTGHEHLQSVGLIHMNARLYDPKLHRFLQPDNYVQDPSNTQNYNRYGYCWNNPLKYNDPSGEFIWFVVALAAFINGEMAATSAARHGGNAFEGFWKGAVVGAISGALGQFGGGVFLNNVIWGVATGIATGGINAALNGSDVGKGMLYGGLIGGAFASLTSLNEMATNYKAGYGFKTDSGVVKNLVKEANINGTIDAIRAQRAIDYVQVKYGMEGAKMTYDNSLKDYGITDPVTGNITIGPVAFSSDAFLKATTVHELGHSILDRTMSNGVFNGWKYPSGVFPANNSTLATDGPLGYAQEIYSYGKMNMGLTNLNSIRSANPLWTEWSKGWFSKTFSLLPMRFENKIILKFY
ncbi:RHS repeat-associated core domain-containing protein [Flavobacterium restrictum]|uniref:RHS repeat-associated core domain-containing protein n=1 Tax=Flavobacterium restrictum TaxID=2594428 RepID=A0A553EAT4_9FLAO|nr:RHS repeat-associated core domain-containing protein [Flavobacterium restrictum]TRX42156.1 hypothetical protein FNW21_02490 [Flavobacterium restrictum]